MGAEHAVSRTHARSAEGSRQCRRQQELERCAAIIAAGAALGGCSDIYYDRRETIALGADDAVASNKVVHMVDPWPRHSANRNIAFNGERMQAAHERYRNNRVITPVNVTTSSAAYQKAHGRGGCCRDRRPPAAADAPAAPVKGP